jgi:hypothetical protein
MNEFFDFLGIKAPFVVAGLFGGLLRALSRRRFKWREVLASPICGMMAAGYLTEPVTFYLRVIGIPMPTVDQQAEYAIAFLIGAVAMWIADLVLEMIVRRFKPMED